MNKLPKLSEEIEALKANVGPAHEATLATIPNVKYTPAPSKMYPNEVGRKRHPKPILPPHTSLKTAEQLVTDGTPADFAIALGNYKVAIGALCTAKKKAGAGFLLADLDNIVNDTLPTLLETREKTVQGAGRAWFEKDEVFKIINWKIAVSFDYCW